MRLNMQFLGGFEVNAGKRALNSHFESDKVRALLSYLAVESGIAHRRESLAYLLWPEFGERAARTNLRRALSNLRSVLDDERAEPSFLLISRQEIEFNDASSTNLDVSEFLSLVASLDGRSVKVSELSQAVKIYQGPFLQGFSIADSDPFEVWLSQWRQRLEDLALQATMQLSLINQKKGNFEIALANARRSLEIDPMHESAYQEIIWLLAALGRKSEAIKEYARLKEILSAELDIAPQERTEELIREIEQGTIPEFPQRTIVLDREPRDVGHSPYKGLAPFQEEDEEYFFGRSQFVQKVSKGLTKRNLVCIVIGPSGSGKSSVTHAGITPKLREKGWQVIAARPKDEPFTELCRAVLTWARPELSSGEINKLAKKYGRETRTGKTTLSDFFSAHIKKSAVGLGLLIILDQFEELFTLTPDESIIRDYLNQILEITKPGHASPDEPIKFLITLRADFMAQALTHRGFADAMEASSFLLGPMSRDELKDAITKPAIIQGAAFEPGLVERILDDVGVGPGNLPLLEFALTQLWDDMDQGWLTHQVYEKIGTIQGALANYAEGVFLELNPQKQEVARRVLLQLVKPGEGTEDTRRVANRTELEEENWQMVQHLADKRLVVTSTSESLIEQAEVVHEVLIWGWERLRNWMEEERAFRVWQERLRISIAEWEVSEEERSALLRGSRLSEAEEQLTNNQELLNSKEVAFIQLSVQNREDELAQKELRRKRTFAGLLTGLLVTLALAFFATDQWRRAETETALATSRELARAAQANLDVDPELSLLLGLEAISISRNSNVPILSETIEVLHSGIQAMRTQLVIDNPDRTFDTVSFDPTGSFIFGWENSSFPGTVMVWDASTGNLVSKHPGIAATREWAIKNQLAVINPAASGLQISFWDIETDTKLSSKKINLSSTPINGTLSFDLSMNAISLENGQIEIWDLEKEEVLLALGEITFHASPAYSDRLAFSHDGTLLASVDSETGKFALWDLQTGELIRDWVGHSGSVNRILFTPNDAVLISASSDATANVWDIATGDLLLTLTGHINEITDLAISADGNKLATSAWDRKIIVWNLKSSIEHGLPDQIMVLSGHQSAVSSVDFDQSGTRMVSSGRDGTIRFWDLEVGSNAEGILLEISGEIPPEYPAVIRISGDGELLAAGNNGTNPKVWDLRRAEILQDFPDHDGTVIFLDLSLDGELLVTTSLDETVRVWEVESGKLLSELPDVGCRECYLAISPDRNSLAVVGDYEEGSIKIYDLDFDSMDDPSSIQLNLRFTLPGNADWIYGGVAYSPDGSRIASAGSGNVVNIWDSITGQEIGELAGHVAPVYGVAFNPAGDRVVTSSQDGTARIWDLATGALLHTLSGHNASVFESRFSPDGALLATASYDGTAKLWDVESGELAYTIRGHASGITSVAFSPDGRYLYTAGLDGQVRAHILDIAELISLVESRIFRDFSNEECRVYLHLESCAPKANNP